jgi:hypothetical protein
MHIDADLIVDITATSNMPIPMQMVTGVTIGRQAVFMKLCVCLPLFNNPEFWNLFPEIPMLYYHLYSWRWSKMQLNVMVLLLLEFL